MRHRQPISAAFRTRRGAVFGAPTRHSDGCASHTSGLVKNVPMALARSTERQRSRATQTHTLRATTAWLRAGLAPRGSPCAGLFKEAKNLQCVDSSRENFYDAFFSACISMLPPRRAVAHALSIPSRPALIKSPERGDQRVASALSRHDFHSVLGPRLSAQHGAGVPLFWRRWRAREAIAWRRCGPRKPVRAPFRGPEKTLKKGRD